ncbi:MAG: hypothetical protein ACYDAE_14500 [Steroidobacteraceae bacterium]
MSTDGRTITNIAANLAAASVPDRKYVADVCSISYQRETVKIIFAQERFDGKGLRSAIVIHMSPRAVVQMLDMFDGHLKEGFEENAKSEHVLPEAMSSFESEPPQVAALSANLAIAAATGREACMDFYQASPFAVGTAAQSRKLAVDGVVRVELSTALLLGLVEDLRKLRSTFPDIKIWKPAT